MSSRLVLQILLALSLMLNTFVLVGFVYRSWIAPPPFERPAPPPPPPGQRPSALETMTHDLDLDDRQREIQKVREQLAAEYRRPTIDMARVDALVDQLTRQRAEQQKETLRSFAQLESQLKPEQQAELHKILAERYGGQGGWRGQRERGPRPPQ